MKKLRVYLIKRHLILAIATALILIACSSIFKPDSQLTNQSATTISELNIWWEQGYNLEEDEAIRRIVNTWQQQTGHQVKLSFYSTDELTAKAARAVKAGHPPDIMMNPKADRILYPLLAWQNQLEDVSDIIKPIERDYSPQVLKAIAYHNSQTETTSYYGVPIDQSTIFVFYWQKLLASIGLNSQDIPRDWDNFWHFWQQAQAQLKLQHNQDIFALGLPISDSTSTSDTHYLFEQILEAHDIALFDQKGRLNVDNPTVRQGIIQCLSWYAELYQQGSIPPEAVNWTDTDNNRSLLNRLSLMTPNVTFSISATVRQDRDTYYNKLGIVEFPNKPNGQPMSHILAIRQAVIFKDSLHKSQAKEFLRYFIQPQITVDYLQASGNRTQPVRNSVWLNSQWQKTQDPYLAVATQVLTSEKTRLSNVVQHPAYSQVLAENVWGKALTQVTANQINPEQATDEAIAEIKQIFQQWQ